MSGSPRSQRRICFIVSHPEVDHIKVLLQLEWSALNIGTVWNSFSHEKKFYSIVYPRPTNVKLASKKQWGPLLRVGMGNGVCCADLGNEGSNLKTEAIEAAQEQISKSYFPPCSNCIWGLWKWSYITLAGKEQEIYEQKLNKKKPSQHCICPLSFLLLHELWSKPYVLFF